MSTYAEESKAESRRLWPGLCPACQHANKMSDSVPPRVSADDLDAGTSTPSREGEPAPQGPMTADIVEIWGVDSFPASDPPANW
jgi:hypothetical protein